MIRSQRDFSTGLLLAAIGVTSAVGAGQRWSTGGATSGSAALAFGLSATITLLGIVLWFTSLTIETEGGEPIVWHGWRSALAVAAAAAVFAAGAVPIGVVASGMGAAALGAWAGRPRPGRGTAALAAAAIACVALAGIGRIGGHPTPVAARPNAVR